MGRLSNSWTVFKQSLGVLRKDKELLVLPILSGLASIVVFASFMFPAYSAGLIERAFIDDPRDPNAQSTMYAVFFVMYLVLSFVTIYFQSALISGANERLAGGDPTISSALRGANQRLGKIFLWSLVAATVSLLIQAIEQSARRVRGGEIIASIIGSILGAAWTLLTFFVIPVVLFEDKGPFAALKRSGQLFKKRWGEAVAGEYGIGWAMSILWFLSALIFMGLAYVGFQASPYIGIFILVAAVLWFVFLAILGQALAGVYKVALYRYAKEGDVVPYFTPQSITGAYRPTYTTADRL